jgi:hypothetical protein
MDEGEGKVFTAVEVQALLDKQRNELNERFAALEARFSTLDAKSALPEVVEVAPKESPNSDKEKVDIPPKTDGPSSHAKPYEYPLERVPMPHMNPSSGAPPMLDEFNYSYWKSCMRSHIRCVCVELFVWSFGALSRMGSLPLMRST